jgi:diguanylate cyclase (GGDEF)-like protein
MPRITNRVFTDLAIWMTSFGLAIGAVFPLFCVALGLPVHSVMTPIFFTATLLAGLLVGAVNFTLAHVVVRSRLVRLALHLNKVQRQLVASTRSGDWSACNPTDCALPVDSTDEFGASARSFNVFIATLARSHTLEAATRRFGQVVASHLELETLGNDALDTILADTEACAGLLLVQYDAELRVVASRGISDPERVAGNAQVASTMRQGEIRDLDVDEDQVIIDSVLLEQTATRVKVVPLRFKDVPMGALVVGSVKPFAPSVDVLMSHYQADLSLALSNAVSHDRLERLAALDPLTDAYNRRFGLVRLQEEFGRALRAEGPLGVLMVDLDHFKAVNDTFGHLVGDRVLRAVASSIRRVSREGDVLIRYGGEEFLMLVPGAASSDLDELGERIRRSVAATEVRDGERRVSVTASLGGAAYPDHDVSSAMELVEAADEALYTSKQSGRDRLTLA